MRAPRWSVLVLGASVLAAPLAGQTTGNAPAAATSAQGDMQSQLVARGLPADLSASVAAVATATASKGLPAHVIVNKAVEGWSKRVPPQRILGAVRDLAQRLERARADLRAAGMAQASGSVIAAAADAAGQGISRGDQVAIVRAAQTDAAASAGLSVAAALVVQGLSPATAAQLVSESYRAGRSAAQVLDLPAAASALQASGVAITDVGRQLLGSIGVGVQGGTGVTVRPPKLPGVP